MTMTETRPTKEDKAPHTNGDGHAQTLADQVVLSSAAFASQGLNNGRRLLGGLLDAVDTIVLGALDGAEQIVRSNLATELAARTVTVTRAAWTTALTGLRDSLATA